MSSLREIKDRIGSIRSTLKITGAMKLVASVKFRKAERALKAIRPYESTLISIFRDTLSAASARSFSGVGSSLGPSFGASANFSPSSGFTSVGSFSGSGNSASASVRPFSAPDSPDGSIAFGHASSSALSDEEQKILDSFTSAQTPSDDKNPQNKVAVVALASNSSLCGSFNSNILRKVEAVLEHLNRNADIFAIGRKIADPLRKAGFPSPAVPIFDSDPSYASLTSGTDLSAKSSTASGSVIDSSSPAARPASPSSLPKFTIGSSSINARSASLSSSATPPSFLDLNDLVTHPTYEAATHLATALIEAYNSGKYAGVVLIYNRFISSSKHEVVLERYLPFEAEGPAVLGKSSASSVHSSSSSSSSSSAPSHPNSDHLPISNSTSCV
jgi:F0F1-type ATP synthase gamma subunit